MKLTIVLYRQNIGWHFKQLWKVKSKKKVIETNVENLLKERGIPVYEPTDILLPKKPFQHVEVVGFCDKPIPLDCNHPNWKKRPCYTYKDNNVLVEGLDQAKILTKTVEIQNGLPESIGLKNTTKEIDNLVKQIIFTSHVFDAEQVKLPKIKDPVRPAHIFPRVYGVSESRRNKLICSKLFNMIETHSDFELVKNRSIVNDVQCKFPFEKSGDLIQFELTADSLLTSSLPLSSVCNADTNEKSLPNMHPLKPTITLVPENFYEVQNIYPIDLALKKVHPHTVYVYYNKLEVQNLFEDEVTEAQIYGRSLLKAFTVAASYAKQQYGENSKLLPKPVTVQCIQSDGRLFHFGILQLNTLDGEDNGIKNIWYQTEQIPLFESCSYVAGRPTLKGYNNSVIKHLFAFYNRS